MAAKRVAELVNAPECCPSVLDAPLDDEEAETLARGFAALADPVRLRLLSLIAAADEVCACDLVEPAGRSQPTVSHHLRVLHEAGLVERERRGTWIWYRLVDERVAAMRGAFPRHRRFAATEPGVPRNSGRMTHVEASGRL